MQSVKFIQANNKQPESVLNTYLTTAPESDWLLCVEYQFVSYWLEASVEQKLTAFYQGYGKQLQRVSLTESTDLFHRMFTTLEECSAAVDQLTKELDLVWFSIAEPLRLVTVDIPKPWGKEIWYTGIEQRGVSQFENAQGECLPMPLLLSVLPERFCRGMQQSITLLKILDPLPEPVYGDLYFEMHREKREVYVVTQVDDLAWPSGKGAIRFGINSEKRAMFSADVEFKAAFQQAISAYHQVRKEIDVKLDQFRADNGFALNEPLAVEQMKSWLAALPEALLEEETELRQKLDEFSQLIELEPGDVVQVPCGVPHALQHGTRVVEFQTPVYERLIISFAQKVLTQSDWDSAEAIEEINLSPQCLPKLERVTTEADESGRRLTVERIVDFKDFEVLRLTLDVGVSYTLASPDYYALLMPIVGEAKLVFGSESELLSAEQCSFIPASFIGGEVQASGLEPLQLLLSLPKAIN